MVLIAQLCANNEEGSSRWSEVVIYKTLPEPPSAPSRPVLKGKAHPNSFKVIWGKSLRGN